MSPSSGEHPTWRKERFLPHWTDLERVIAVTQTQTASNIRVTLVSIEIYSGHGFLVTTNVDTLAPDSLFDRAGRGWMRATIADQQGNQYISLMSMIPGLTHAHLFHGRAVLVCMPPMAVNARHLSLTIDAIEWESREAPDAPPSIETFPGPWDFAVPIP
jgi:hypothetical protein